MHQQARRVAFGRPLHPGEGRRTSTSKFLQANPSLRLAQNNGFTRKQTHLPAWIAKIPSTRRSAGVSFGVDPCFASCTKKSDFGKLRTSGGRTRKDAMSFSLPSGRASSRADIHLPARRSSARIFFVAGIYQRMLKSNGTSPMLGVR